MQYDEQAMQAVRERRLLIDEYDSWLVEELRPFLGQRVIEVGCGLGNLLKHFIDRELVVGIETCSETVMEVQRKFADFGNVLICEYGITDPSPPSGQLRIFNAVVPILKAAERAFPPPFGISLMTVAQRKGEVD